MNSYFATVEQQANPYLRGKPVGVKGSHAKRTIIAAASVEAKKYGVKTGMPEHEALKICPELIVVVGEPRKYSFVTKKFIEIFGRYTDVVEIFSIDEAFLDITNTSHLYVSKSQITNLKLQIKSKIQTSNQVILATNGDQNRKSPISGNDRRMGSLHLGRDDRPKILNSKYQILDSDIGAVEIARRIKKDIRREIGEWLTCSIGVAPNKFLAKLGSDLEKPDGLTTINKKNKDEILLSCKLTDFCGIANRIEKRLHYLNIFTVRDLRNADDLKLKKEFGVYGLKLKKMAWGIDNSSVGVWEEQSDAKSFGHSRTLNRDVTKREEIQGQLYLLSEKVAKRMRNEGYYGKEVGVWIRFKDFTGAGRRHRIGYWVNDGYEIYKAASKALDEIYFPVAQYRGSAGCPDCHSGIASWNGQYPESRETKNLDSHFRGNDRKGSSRLRSNNKKPIRAMGVYVARVSKNVPYPLFCEDRDREKIMEIMDKVNNKYGEGTLFKGALLNFPFKEIVSGMGRKKF